MRREIAASMQAVGFWGDLGAPANIDFGSETPPDLGVSELDHPPLYYALLALPQYLANQEGVEVQLYLARFGSVLLYLVVVAAAYGLVVELFPRRSMLPLAVAGFIALLPPLTDLMSAINNDAGAAAAVSLLLWASVRLLRRGPSLVRVGVVLLLAGVCAATKSTATLAAVIVLFILGVSHVPRSQRRWVWVGLTLLVPVALVAVFSWGGQAAYWLTHDQPGATNRLVSDGPLGRSVFVLAAESEDYPRVLFQELPSLDGRNLRGRTVTFGAWLRAAEGGRYVALNLDDGQANHWHRVEATTDWQFYAFTATIATEAPSVAAYVIVPQREDAAKNVQVDGVVLVDDEIAEPLPPEFETVDAAMGRWGSEEFTNLLRNGSAERVWPGLRAWVQGLSLFRYPIYHVLQSLWDWQRTRWAYRGEFRHLLQTFWGRFGWGNVALPGAYFYFLGLITVVGIAGAGIGLVRWIRSGVRREPWRRSALVILGTTFLVSWGVTVLRIHPVFLTTHVYWPVARYATVAIVPTALLLCLGLAELVPRRWLPEAAWIGLLGMIALDAIAIWSVILPYHYG
jgi:hypothetical protein